MTKKFALILTIFATVTLTFATTSTSSAPSQGAGKASMRDFSFVVITGDAIRRLPSGENTIYVATSGGGVWKTTNGGRSWNLTKTGPDTWILPNSNDAGLSKVGTGTLVLSSTSSVVYEFRNLRSPEFDRILMPGGANLKTYLQQHRPQGAMKGWPFQRLLIGPAKGIAQREGWKRGLTANPTPGSKFICAGGSCVCNGTADCLSLAVVCSSEMNCDSSGDRIRCYCNN